MLARDQGTPTSRVGPSARVVVNVLRNRQAPRFLGTPYVKNITEAQETGSTVFTVRSEDGDDEVMEPSSFRPNWQSQLKSTEPDSEPPVLPKMPCQPVQ